MHVEHDQLVGTSSRGARRADGGRGAAQAAVNSRDNEERAELERLRKAARAPGWPKPAVNLLNTVFENGDFEELYTTMLPMISPSHQPDVDLILQLYAVMLYPRDCRSDLIADLVDDLDFCSTASSPSAISTLVHQLLLAILHTNGPDRLLANLPRRTSEGIPGLPKRRASHTLRLDMVDMSRKEEDDFIECHFAARRIGLAKDVWQIIAGKAAKEGSHAASTRSAEPRVKQESSPWAEGMTPFLDILVQAWELEARVMALDEQHLGRPFSPSLLSQLTPSAFGLPSDFFSVLEIAFQPLVAPPAASVMPSSSAKDIDLGLRLLTLLADLATSQHVSDTALLKDLVDRMQDLKLHDFRSFVTRAFVDRPKFKMRLFISYMERFSAEVTIEAIEIDDKEDEALNRRVAERDRAAQRARLAAARATIDNADGGDDDDIIFVSTSPARRPAAPGAPTSSSAARPARLISDDELEIVPYVLSSQRSSGAPFSSGAPRVKQERPTSSASQKMGVPSATPQSSAPTSSRSRSPTKASASREPIHMSPNRAIICLFEKVPKQLTKPRPTKGVPARAQGAGGVSAAATGPSSAMINAEVRHAAIKLEALQVFVHFAREEGDKALARWRSALQDTLRPDGRYQDGKVKRALRAGRKHLLVEGELPEQIGKLQAMEDLVLATVL